MTADSTQMQRPVMNPHEKRMQTIQAVLYVIAIILGLINGFYGSEFWIQTGEFISTIFIRLFRFIAVPIIAVSIIATLSQISRSTESGRIFRQSVFNTLLTTFLAAALAAILFEVFSPANVTLSDTTEASAAIAGIKGKSYFDYITSVVPDNAIAPFLSANVLSVLLIAAAVGIAIAKLPHDSREQRVLMAFFSGFQALQAGGVEHPDSSVGYLRLFYGAGQRNQRRCCRGRSWHLFCNGALSQLHSDAHRAACASFAARHQPDSGL